MTELTAHLLQHLRVILCATCFCRDIPRTVLESHVVAPLGKQRLDTFKHVRVVAVRRQSQHAQILVRFQQVPRREQHYQQTDVRVNRVNDLRLVHVVRHLENVWLIRRQNFFRVLIDQMQFALEIVPVRGAELLWRLEQFNNWPRVCHRAVVVSQIVVFSQCILGHQLVLLSHSVPVHFLC